VSLSRMRRAAATAVLATAFVAAPGGLTVPVLASLPTPTPSVSDAQFVSAGLVPPSTADCYAVNRRCFSPQSMRASYGVDQLIAHGTDGTGRTIAIIDSFGYPTVGSDLANFSRQFGLPVPCGETGVACTPGTPSFTWVDFGNHQIKAPPDRSRGTGQEDSSAWALEVALDVQWTHAFAPKANILLVTTPTAETLGVQGFPQFMEAISYVSKNHLADVISNSYGSGEAAFHSGTAALMNLRKSLQDARDNGVTVLASSGDGGTTNSMKEPVKNPRNIPYPSVGWPASDPLVTGVGGTYLCTDAETGTHTDSAHPGGLCPSFPGAREVAWTNSGGGFSEVFGRPDYQNPATAPAGSTPYQAMRGVPDIGLQASSRTGVLIYDTSPEDAGGSNVGNPGWYIIGGTSASCPMWAGLVADAAQLAGHRLGLINDDLYALAATPAGYAANFRDIATGNVNQTDPSIPGYPAGPGWDPVTGLGTPRADVLVPALAAHAATTN
jgi:subtilase family serine protease